MVYKLAYSESAEKDLKALDDSIVKRILKKMDEIMSLKNPLIKAKRLKNVKEDIYRFRIGDYRIIFRIDRTTMKLIVLLVLKIAHRKEVYRFE